MNCFVALVLLRNRGANASSITFDRCLSMIEKRNVETYKWKNSKLFGTNITILYFSDVLKLSIDSMGGERHLDKRHSTFMSKL